MPWGRISSGACSAACSWCARAVPLGFGGGLLLSSGWSSGGVATTDGPQDEGLYYKNMALISTWGDSVRPSSLDAWTRLVSLAKIPRCVIAVEEGGAWAAGTQER